MKIAQIFVVLALVLACSGKESNSIISAFGSAASIIQQACGTWQSVVGAFKSSKNQTLEQTLAGQGFAYFAQSAQTQKIGGLMDSFLPEFLTQLAGRLQVPADKQQDFIDVCQDIMYEEETTWSAYNIFFNQGTGNQIKYATLMMNHNQTDSTVNFLIADMQATFQLAPNVMVIGQQASYAGGIWSSSTLKYKDVPQSLTEDDIQEIFDFFFIVSMKELGELVGVNVTFPNISTPTDNSIISAFGSAASIIQQACGTWQSVVGAFASSKNQTLEQTLAGQGFDYFAQSAQTQKIGGLMDSFLPQFLTQLATRLEVPADKQQDFLDVCQDIIYEEETTWSAYNIFFNKGSSNQIKYATLMMNHNQTDSTVNFLIADMQATFELAPNVMVISQQASYAGGIWSSSTLKYKDVPQSLTEDDITEIFDFFYIVSMKELGELVGVNVSFPNISTPTDNSIISAFGSAASIIQQACGTWQSIVGAFKSSKNQTLMQTLAGKGFDYFAQSAQTQKIGGLMESFLPTFLTQLASRLEVPADKQQDFMDVLQDIVYEEETTWSAYNIFFNKGSSNQIKYATIMMNHNQTDSTVNFLLADMQATFELAPDVMVIGQSASYAGGIWSSNTLKFKNIPQSLTEDDITEIFDFFYIISMKELGELVGVNVSFPNISTPTSRNSIISAFGSAASIIQQACGTWQSIVGAFKSSKNQTLMQTLAGQGFDYFAQSAQTQKIGGLMESFLPQFLTQLATRLEVPADKQQDFLDVCQDIIYEEETTWSAYNIFFNKGQSNQIKYATLMMNHNSTDSTVNFLIADMQATFALAPNVMVISQQASYAGGIWSSNTIKFKNVPQSLTEDDITEIFDFFYIVSMKELGELVGVNVSFPNISTPTMKRDNLQTVVRKARLNKK